MISETRFLPADKPDAVWKVILPRVNDVEYDVKHRGDHFFIEIRDKDRPNSEVLVAPVSDPTKTKVIFKMPLLHCVTWLWLHMHTIVALQCFLWLIMLPV